MKLSIPPKHTVIFFVAMAALALLLKWQSLLIDVDVRSVLLFASGVVFTFLFMLAHRSKQKGKTFELLSQQKEQSRIDKIDTTKSQQRDQHITQMKTLGEMGRGLAHEINSPLASLSLILDNLETKLERGILDIPNLRESLRKIHTVSKRISAIVNSVSDFSRNNLSEEPSAIPIKQLVDDLVLLSSARLRSENVAMEVDLQCDSDLAIYFRFTHLSQVCLNIINNAVDELKNAGEKKIRLSAIREGNYLTISISDSGKGIPQDLREKIFEPAFTTKPKTNFGVGLALCKDLCEINHGSIEIHSSSELGGAEFRILVPVFSKACEYLNVS